MKNIIVTIACFAVGASSSWCGMQPANLRCEYLANPLGIGSAEPRLLWQLESDQRAQRQTACQILVASSASILASGKGDLWDSGKIVSDQTAHVVYEGRPLSSRIAAFWKVRVWDQDDNPSQWSAPAQWQIGLLNDSDWQAKWIGLFALPASGQEKPAQTTNAPHMLRKAFSVNGQVKKATAYVSALGLYELRLNGSRIGDHVLAPEWTDYHKRVQYQAYDVTGLIRPVENVVGAFLADGWYAGRMGLAGIVANGPVRGIYGAAPLLLAQLEIEFADGSRQVIASDSTWRATVDGPIRSADLFDGEVYDARQEMHGWDCPGFDDSQWKSAEVQTGIKTKLVAQANEPIRVVAELKPVSITEPAPGCHIFDMGQNMVGWCRLKARGPRGQTITLRHAEVLKPDGALYTDNLRGVAQTDTFILRGDGQEVFEPRFAYHGFRYVEVRGLTAKPSLDSLTGCVVHSDAPRAGHFECSNPRLNQLMANILWTQRGNLHSTPTDCPQRDERMGWMGDAQIFSQTACFNMDMAAFFTKWLGDVRDAQAEDGRYPDFAPHPFDPNKRFSGAPGWADAGVIIPWRMYVNYGDKRLLEEHFDSAKRWIDYVHGSNPDLIWRKNRGNDYNDWLNADTLVLPDWPKSGGAVPKEIYATAFFAHSTELVSRMATVLGKKDEATRYSELAEAIKAAFCHEFVQPDGRIQGGTQAGYALALHFDLLPKELRQSAARHLIEAIKQYNWHPSTGIQSTPRMMLELTRTGCHDVAWRLLTNRAAPSWFNMIDHGATTIWERWDGFIDGRLHDRFKFGYQDPGMNSFNHYAFGSVGEWIYRHILGINPDENQPAFKHFIIRPRPVDGLDWARGSCNSIRGKIAVDWRIRNDLFKLDVTIPANTTATVYLPAAGPDAITESDKPLSMAQGVELIEISNGIAALRVGSGKYRFISRGSDNEQQAGD